MLEHTIASIDPYNEASTPSSPISTNSTADPRDFAALVLKLATIDSTPSPDIDRLL